MANDIGISSIRFFLHAYNCVYIVKFKRMNSGFNFIPALRHQVVNKNTDDGSFKNNPSILPS